MAECPYCGKNILLTTDQQKTLVEKNDTVEYRPVKELEDALLEYVKSMKENERIKLGFHKEDDHIIIQPSSYVPTKHWKSLNKIVMAHGGTWHPKTGEVGFWEVPL